MRGRGSVELKEKYDLFTNQTIQRRVSVPLRGKGSVELYLYATPKIHSCLIRFPSPCGERVLLNWPRTYTASLATPPLKFPSPCGERVLLNAQIQNLKDTGSIFKFPSPCGERVLLNLIELMDATAEDCGIGFPSPCGERVLLNLSARRRACRNAVGIRVSVPLRGKGSVER